MGSGVPIYSGAVWQRGYGLGGIMGSMMRAAVPLLKEYGKNMLKDFAKKGARTTLGLASDALRGRNMEEALRNRLSQTSSPLKRKKPTATKSKKKTKTKKARISKQKDIFS